MKGVGYRSDVEPGEGALCLTPEGWVAVVINGGNAAKAIGVTTGDGVVLEKEAKPSGEGNIDSLCRLFAAV